MTATDQPWLGVVLTPRKTALSIIEVYNCKLTNDSKKQAVGIAPTACDRFGFSIMPVFANFN